MKKISIMSLCVGVVLGATCALMFIWLWQIVTGNTSMTTIALTTIVTAGIFVCCRVQRRIALKKAEEAHTYKLRKYQSYYYLFASWMVLRNKGRMLADYFENRNMKNIAICGLGRLGLCLYEELKGSNINVKYAIDTKAESFSYLNLKVITTENHLEMVDVIVVTKFFDLTKITEELLKKTSSQVVSLEDVIFSM